MIEAASIMKDKIRKLTASILPLLVFTAVAGASCDVALYDFASEMSKYGAKWSYDDVAAAVVVEFPEDVVNADVLANYNAYMESGTGTVALSNVTYDSVARTATLPITFANTDGSKFHVEIVSSDTPITMGTRVLDGYTSPGFKSPDAIAPYITAWNPSSGSSIAMGTATIRITYSEDVQNADSMSSYYISAGATLQSVSYDSGSHTATLSLSVEGPAATNVSITVINSSILDQNGNVMTTASPGNYMVN